MDNKYEDDIFNVQDRLKTLNEAAGPASSKDNKRGWTLLPAWIFIAAVAVIVLAVIMNTKIRAAVSLKSARKNAADQNYEQAITDYEKVVRLDQSNTAAYFELQKVYIETGDIENADKISYRACIPINEEFFPDDNFRAYIQEAFDPEKRGKLYSRERIDRLDVSCKQIRSLKGIEYFSKV
ncbi:MAG: tetratricopeptide repeat protein, partial [Lachnospiraceae bacterium]|nr:tetratricopeptide repeat protein [Lachnospiraceae bacterium]